MDMDATGLWLATRSMEDFRQALDAGFHADLFVGGSRTAWTFIENYAAEHGELPGISLVVQHAGVAIRPPESGDEVALGFLLTRLHERARHRALKVGLVASLEALETDQQDEAAAAVVKLNDTLADIDLAAGRARSRGDTCAEIDAHLLALRARWGKPVFGIAVPSFPTLNVALSGLWGGIILAAAPNIGKTSFVGHLALDALTANDDVSVVMLSLEMTHGQILTRFLAQISGRSTREITLGGERPGYRDALLGPRLDEAAEKLKKVGRRLRVLDRAGLPNVSLSSVRRAISRLRDESGARRVLLIVDSLQRLPGASGRKTGELDDDRARYELLQQLRFWLGDDAAILTISESRKPSSSKGGWGGSMADVRGHAGATYAADCVCLLSPMTAEESTPAGSNSRLKLAVEKVRDPGYRAIVPLTFDYRCLRFAELPSERPADPEPSDDDFAF
jgi:replicative DNA helicase